jgi:DNA-directed RNA polymerase specialized sigma24 family protein
MLTLFENDGQILRAWDPNRGMKLRSFVSLVVRRYIFRTFRGFRGNPWSSHPFAAAEITAYLDDQIAQGPTLLADVEYRIQLAQVLDGLNKKLSERDWRLFTRLFVDQSKPAAIGDEEGMRENAVHQWKRRFVQRLGEMFGSSPAPAARERVIDHA